MSELRLDRRKAEESKDAATKASENASEQERKADREKRKVEMQNTSFRHEINRLVAYYTGERFEGQKLEACEKLDKMVDKMGHKGVSQLIACGGKYPEDFKQARAFCRTCDMHGGVLKGCLSSYPQEFMDQHDGDRKMVTLNGNKFDNIPPMGHTGK